MSNPGFQADVAVSSLGFLATPARNTETKRSQCIGHDYSNSPTCWQPCPSFAEKILSAGAPRKPVMVTCSSSSSTDRNSYLPEKLPPPPAPPRSIADLLAARRSAHTVHQGCQRNALRSNENRPDLHMLSWAGPSCGLRPGEPVQVLSSGRYFRSERRRSDGRNATSGAPERCSRLSRAPSGPFSRVGVDRDNSAG